MIYTSYFASPILRNNDKYKAICITAFPPKWFNGPRIAELSPPRELVLWAKCQDMSIYANQKYYTEAYTYQVLDAVNIDKCIEFAERIAGNKTPVLCCFETPDKFCHRHLLAERMRWLGYECEELSQDNAE